MNLAVTGSDDNEAAFSSRLTKHVDSTVLARTASELGVARYWLVRDPVEPVQSA
jgi:hypothetical protein